MGHCWAALAITCHLAPPSLAMQGRNAEQPQEGECHEHPSSLPPHPGDKPHTSAATAPHLTIHHWTSACTHALLHPVHPAGWATEPTSTSARLGFPGCKHILAVNPWEIHKEGKSQSLSWILHAALRLAAAGQSPRKGGSTAAACAPTSHRVTLHH